VTSQDDENRFYFYTFSIFPSLALHPNVQVNKETTKITQDPEAGAKKAKASAFTVLLRIFVQAFTMTVSSKVHRVFRRLIFDFSSSRSGAIDHKSRRLSWQRERISGE
jgi:hypothetical protein